MTDGDSARLGLPAAHSAFASGDWADARQRFEALEAGGVELGAEDLEAFGYAALLEGADSADELERAAEAYEAAGHRDAAVRLALDLGRMHMGQGRKSLAIGWIRRAQRMLDDGPEGAGHAHLLVFNAFMVQMGGQLSQALTMIEQAHALARKYGDRDAECLALNRRGRILVLLARAEEGKADLDEAMLLVRRGAVRPVAAALVYCSTIDACSDMGDYERALQWTEAASAWIEKRQLCGFPGICRVHRAELKRLRGDHDGARREAQEALAVYERFHFRINIPDAHGELGMQSLEEGDLEGAEAAFALAREGGHTPLPGSAILHLRRGDPTQARALLEPALQAAGENRLARARLLPTLVEAALELGDIDAARAAVEELDQTASLFGTVGLRAGVSSALARLHLFEGNVDAALHSARAATREWNIVGASYELARARDLLGDAYAIADEPQRGRVERDIVQSQMNAIGAVATILATDAATQVADYADGVPQSLHAKSRIGVGVTIDDKLEVGPMLGAGGMGVVYMGRHRLTGREVAIKVLQRSLCGDDVQCGRFLQEALACGRIKHLNVVDIYDAGEHGGEPYIVMELLCGEPLAERLNRTPKPSIDEALEIAEQVARGLGAAHAAGIVHRDIKPDNIFLCAATDEPRLVKVLDFGISKLPDAHRTRAGAVLGTPYYMAPEQVRDGRSVDKRTDVHGLGAVLFEMLTGRPPYLADGVMAVLYSIAEGEPTSISSLRPDLPSAVVDLVEKAIARDPAKRFGSGSLMAQAIAHLRSGEAPTGANLGTRGPSRT